MRVSTCVFYAFLMIRVVLTEPAGDGLGRSGRGVFEGDIMLTARSRLIAFPGEQNVQFGATGNVKLLWPNATIYYTVEEDISKWKAIY